MTFPAGSRNSAKISLRQVVLQAVAPPQVDAHVGGRRTLFWTATDAGTPWLHLVVRLDAGSKHRYRDLGRRPLAGRLVIPVPPGAWQATVVAGNSAHQAVTVQLGTVTG